MRCTPRESHTQSKHCPRTLGPAGRRTYPCCQVEKETSSVQGGSCLLSLGCTPRVPHVNLVAGGRGWGWIGSLLWACREEGKSGVRMMGTQKTVPGRLPETPGLGAKFPFYNSRQWENSSFCKTFLYRLYIGHICPLSVAWRRVGIR